jgi:demethylmenaquinone methyltransferase/2-methoxy-6-polyprenyl-1,4-benzoquinol methylase
MLRPYAPTIAPRGQLLRENPRQSAAKTGGEDPQPMLQSPPKTRPRTEAFPRMPISPETARVPRRIFSPIARGYDTPAQVLGLFQYRRWHRFLLSRLSLEGRQRSAVSGQPESVRPEPIEEPISPAQAERANGAAEAKARNGSSAAPSTNTAATTPTLTILDMATGTGALALDLASHPNVRVVGADITRPMLSRALTRAGSHRKRIDLIEATAEAPPFRAESFDAITFAYLLRYVEDVPATLRELARLLRPGGVMASLDFAVPAGIWYPLWRVYTDAVLPAAGLVFSPSWRRVGSFLGPSIRQFDSRWPEPLLLEAWREAGFADVRARRLSLGGATVIWGTKE